METNEASLDWSAEDDYARRAWVDARADSGTLHAEVSAIVADFVAEYCRQEGRRYVLSGIDAVPTICRLLHTVRVRVFGYYGYPNLSHEFVRHGPLAYPITPEGVILARVLSEHARYFVANAVPSALFGPDLGISAIEKLVETGELFRSKSLQNATEAEPVSADFGGNVKLKLLARHGTFASLPRGTDGPKPFLAPSLIGTVVDDVEDWREQTGACVCGVSDFLNRFGIAHYRSGGEYECEYCGSTVEDDCGEGERIENCETFELTPEMVAALDQEGYLDQTLEYFDLEDSSPDWETFLREHTDTASMLAALMPERTEGLVAYDTSRWVFEPDYGEISGIGDLDAEDLCRLLPAIVAVVDHYASLGVLPPVPGILRAGDVALAWDPDEYELRYVVSSRSAVLVWDPIREYLRIRIPDTTYDVVTVSDPEPDRPDDWKIVYSASLLPPDVKILVQLAQNSVDFVR